MEKYVQAGSSLFYKKKLFPSDIRSAIQDDMVKMYAKSSMGLYSVLKKYGMSEYQRGKIDFCCGHLQTHTGFYP